MEKYLVTIKLVYNDAPKSDFLSGITQKTITIGVYDTQSDAITNGNKALEKFEKYFPLNPNWNVKESFSFGSSITVCISFCKRSLTPAFSYLQTCVRAGLRATYCEGFCPS